MGASSDRPAPQSPAATKRGYDYQNFVCPWHWYSPSNARIEEWNFAGVDFDGLHPVDCHLYEAKHGYDGFLESDGWGVGGEVRLKRWASKAQVQANVFDRMIEQARRQHQSVLPHFGQVELTWVFSHAVTRLYVGRLFLRRIKGWYHHTEERPWTNG